ncbi:hypothetical protein V6N11_047086 [Hibiscus sabdariffa]|uniref:Uncharacterized protein n=1 Tax=Hibiscus sabdariffa TaxID=183260 RepID=A0ABR1ZNM1_9ROSI
MSEPETSERRSKKTRLETMAMLQTKMLLTDDIKCIAGKRLLSSWLISWPRPAYLARSKLVDKATEMMTDPLFLLNKLKDCCSNLETVNAEFYTAFKELHTLLSNHFQTDDLDIGSEDFNWDIEQLHALTNKDNVNNQGVSAQPQPLFPTQPQPLFPAQPQPAEIMWTTSNGTYLVKISNLEVLGSILTENPNFDQGFKLKFPALQSCVMDTLASWYGSMLREPTQTQFGPNEFTEMGKLMQDISQTGLDHSFFQRKISEVYQKTITAFENAVAFLS